MKNAIYDITIGFGPTRTIVAKTLGAAANQAFRSAIKAGEIRNRPPTDRDTGGWQGVHVAVRNEHVGRLGWWKGTVAA